MEERHCTHTGTWHGVGVVTGQAPDGPVVLLVQSCPCGASRIVQPEPPPDPEPEKPRLLQSQAIKGLRR